MANEAAQDDREEEVRLSTLAAGRAHVSSRSIIQEPCENSRYTSSQQA